MSHVPFGRHLWTLTIALGIRRNILCLFNDGGRIGGLAVHKFDRPQVPFIDLTQCLSLSSSSLLLLLSLSSLSLLLLQSDEGEAFCCS